MRGIASSEFKFENVSVKREAFYNYPDNVLVYKISTDKEMDFSVNLVIPNLGARPVEQGGRTGSVKSESECLIMRGSLPSKDLLFEGRLFIQTDGTVCYDGDAAHIKNSRESVIFFVFDTSYKLCPETFKKSVHKALGEDPHEKVSAMVACVKFLGYEELFKRHINDLARFGKNHSAKARR